MSEEELEAAEDEEVVQIGYEEVKLMEQPRIAKQVMTTLFSKTKRAELSEDKRNDFFDKATKAQLPKFDLMSVSLKDDEKLEDTYNIGIQIGKVKKHFVRYDMHDVFTVLSVREDGKTLYPVYEKNLFEDYATLSEEDVARSNAWYNTWPSAETYPQNLQLTYEFLQNHMTEELWEKCLETYETYDEDQLGGPLLFIIMVKTLQSDTEAAVQYLQDSVKGLKITNFDGENVSRVVSLIRGAYKRLKGVGQNKVPEEFPKWLVTIFQTSTVPEFNEVFAHVQRNAELAEMGPTRKPEWPNVESILRLATNRYLDLCATDKWTGITTKGTQSIFQAVQGGRSEPICWNCSQKGHRFNDCPKPRNEQAIEQRKKELFDKKKDKKKKGKGQAENKSSEGGGKTKNFKFAPPTQEEKNRRVIDGKPMFWNAKKKRWVPDLKVQVAQTASTSTMGATPTANVAQRSAIRDAALSNTTHAITSALQSFADLYKE
jgi:hypothetical protein